MFVSIYNPMLVLYKLLNVLIVASEKINHDLILKNDFQYVKKKLIQLECVWFSGKQANSASLCTFIVVFEKLVVGEFACFLLSHR